MEELVQSQLTWIGANSVFPKHMPQKIAGELKMELELLNFSNKATVRLNTTIEKIVEKCKDFYKKMCTTHNRCQDSVATQVQEFPNREKNLKNLQDKLQINEQSIQKIEIINEEAIKIWVSKLLFINISQKIC